MNVYKPVSPTFPVHLQKWHIGTSHFGIRRKVPAAHHTEAAERGAPLRHAGPNGFLGWRVLRSISPRVSFRYPPDSCPRCHGTTTNSLQWSSRTTLSKSMLVDRRVPSAVLVDSKMGQSFPENPGGSFVPSRVWHLSRLDGSEGRPVCHKLRGFRPWRTGLVRRET